MSYNISIVLDNIWFKDICIISALKEQFTQKWEFDIFGAEQQNSFAVFAREAGEMC